MDNYITLPYSDYKEAVALLQGSLISLPQNSKNNIIQALFFLRHEASAKSITKISLKVYEGIDGDCFSETDKEEIDEICLIIADVLLMEPYSSAGQPEKLRIGGVLINIFTVQEIYQKLTHEHVAHVLEKFKGITNKINNKQSYIRTVLYNTVFELNLDCANQFHSR